MIKRDRNALLRAARLLENWAKVEWESNVNYCPGYADHGKITDVDALRSYKACTRSAKELRSIAGTKPAGSPRPPDGPPLRQLPR